MNLEDHLTCQRDADALTVKTDHEFWLNNKFLTSGTCEAYNDLCHGEGSFSDDVDGTYDVLFYEGKPVKVTHFDYHSILEEVRISTVSEDGSQYDGPATGYGTVEIETTSTWVWNMMWKDGIKIGGDTRIDLTSKPYSADDAYWSALGDNVNANNSDWRLFVEVCLEDCTVADGCCDRYYE